MSAAVTGVRAGSLRPARAALRLVGVSVGVTIAGALLLQLAAPRSDETLRRLVVVLVLLVVSVAVARRVGWADVGAAGPGTWRSRGWLFAPLAVAVVPLAWGWSPEPATLLTLAVGYAATGVYEELWFRGLVLHRALPLGPARASALSASLFGAAHLANVLFGQNVVITASQAVGAAAFGFGYAVLRLRTNAVWALAGTHAVLDLLLHTTGLHGAALWSVMVGQDVLLLLIGLVAVRGVCPHGSGHAAA